MTVVRFYVRGHGSAADSPLPPPSGVALNVVTVGQFGSTMSDQVADAIIYGNYTHQQIQAAIDARRIIYWTRTERDQWEQHQVLSYTVPPLGFWDYNTLTVNLTLEGDADLGQCGLCYWNEATSQRVWVAELEDGATMTLGQMAQFIGEFLSGHEDVSAELYWAACMSADYWHGTARKVSRNPRIL